MLDKTTCISPTDGVQACSMPLSQNSRDRVSRWHSMDRPAQERAAMDRHVLLLHP